MFFVAVLIACEPPCLVRREFGRSFVCPAYSWPLPLLSAGQVGSEAGGRGRSKQLASSPEYKDKKLLLSAFVLGS